MAEGHGDSLGQALINALARQAGGSAGARRTYTAKGWHAQLSKLTSQPRGYEAAARAGLSATAPTLKNWLSDPDYPIRRGDRERIAKAYAIMAGRWPGDPQGEIAIRGTVKIGRDVRDRGARGTAPFRVDAAEGDWTRIREAWDAGDVDAGDVEEWFIEDVVEADLGEGTDRWEFTGSLYTVTI